MSTQPNTPPTPRVMSRMRRFLTRHVPFTIAGALALIVVITLGAYFYLSSAYFENVMRDRSVRNIEELTGGRVEIASFHWNLLESRYRHRRPRHPWSRSARRSPLRADRSHSYRAQYLRPGKPAHPAARSRCRSPPVPPDCLSRRRHQPAASPAQGQKQSAHNRPVLRPQGVARYRRTGSPGLRRPRRQF